MKLRIHEHSLRIRTASQDVRELAETGQVEARIQLSPERALVYRLSIAPEARWLAVVYSGDLIDVRLPAEAAREWCSTDREALSGSQMNGDTELRIVVEKDFDPSE